MEAEENMTRGRELAVRETKGGKHYYSKGRRQD